MAKHKKKSERFRKGYRYSRLFAYAFGVPGILLALIGRYTEQTIWLQAGMVLVLGMFLFFLMSYACYIGIRLVEHT